MRLSAQSGLVIVINSLIEAVVAAIVVFLMKGHSRILLQRRSEEIMKSDLPKKVQRTYEYETVCFSIWQSRIWRQNWPGVRIGWLIGESKRAWEGTWELCFEKGIYNSSNHVLESGLELCTISNGVVSLRPSWPGNWFSTISACCTAKYLHSRLTCFYLMNACAIWIRVRNVHSANPFEDCRPAGAAMMLETFDNIHPREFPLINFLLKSEWNRWGRRPASALNSSNAEVIDVDDSDEIP